MSRIDAFFTILVFVALNNAVEFLPSGAVVAINVPSGGFENGAFFRSTVLQWRVCICSSYAREQVQFSFTYLQTLSNFIYYLYFALIFLTKI